MSRRSTHTSRAALASMGSAADTLRAISYRLIHEAGPRGMTALEVVAASGRDRWGIHLRDGRPSHGPLVIGEGFATMAAVHHATGYGVVAAMSARNLEAVARTMRALHGPWLARQPLEHAEIDRFVAAHQFADRWPRFERRDESRHRAHL